MHEAHGSWLHFLSKILPLWIPEPVYFSWVVMLILIAFAYLATKDLKKIPGSLQAFAEIVVEGLDNFTKGVIGPTGAKYTPLIGSFFLYILVMNSMGVFPGFIPPTSNLNTTIALALVTFCAMQYAGISSNGIVGHIKHFMGEPLWMAPLMFPIHVVGELAKPFSLSIRLFANIFGDEKGIMSLLVLLPLLYKYIIPVPTYALMIVLGILVVIVQALIFSLLSAIYISIAIGHGGHDEHHESAAAHH